MPTHPVQRSASIKALARHVPNELQCEIMRHCTEGDLARLARVHSSWKVEAERMLYSTLNIMLGVDESAARARLHRLLESLGNYDRCALVKVVNLVVFENVSGCRSASPRALLSQLRTLCQLLPQMVNVYDLRIHNNCEASDVAEILNKELNGCVFRLDTLICDSSLDICAIVHRHGPGLKLLGLTTTKPFDEASILDKFYGSGPERVAFRLETYRGRLDGITLYPIFNAPEHWPLAALEERILPALQMFESPFASETFPEGLHTIQLAFRNVDQLAAILDHSRDDLVAANAWPHVKRLEITLWNDTLKPDMLFPDLTPILASFPKLRGLAIRALDKDDPPNAAPFQHDSQIQRQWIAGNLVKECLKVLPKIELIAVDLGTETVRVMNTANSMQLMRALLITLASGGDNALE